MPSPEDFSPSDSTTPSAGNETPREDLASFKLNSFYKDEEQFCQQVEAVATALIKFKTELSKAFSEAYKNFPNDLKKKYKQIDFLIMLYKSLSINYFELTSEQKKFSIEEKFELILKVIESQNFKNRVALLNDAGRLYTPLCNAIVPIIKDNEDFAVTDRENLKNFLSAPMQRVLRMNNAVKEVQEKYAKESDCLSRIVRKIGKLAVAVNVAQDIPSPDQRRKNFNHALAATINVNKFQGVRLKGKPEGFDKFCEQADTEHQQKEKIVEQFENRYTNIKISALKVQDILAMLQDHKPVDKLQLLEKAFGEIRTQAAKNKSVSYFFRGKFPYTKAQLGDIKLLKNTYLKVVEQTPYEPNSEFEKYLENHYKKNQKAEEGGLLGFNRTTVFWNIRKRTTSMKVLEELKAGVNRIR